MAKDTKSGGKGKPVPPHKAGFGLTKRAREILEENNTAERRGEPVAGEQSPQPGGGEIALIPHPCPHHCPPSGGGGLGPVVAGALAVFAAAAVAAPAVTTAVHVAELVLQVVLMTVASLVGLAVLAGAAIVAVRVARWRAERITDVSFPPLPPPQAQRPVQALPAPQRKAIEAPRQAATGLGAVNRERFRRVPHP